MSSLQPRSAQSWRLQSQPKLVPSFGSIHLSSPKPSAEAGSQADRNKGIYDWRWYRKHQIRNKETYPFSSYLQLVTSELKATKKLQCSDPKNICLHWGEGAEEGGEIFLSPPPTTTTPTCKNSESSSW